MPKNNSGLTTKSKPRPKSTARKPLRDVSNAVKTFSTSIATKLPVKYQEDEEGNQLRQVGDHDGALDRLLLIHSDISSIIHQIDGLVAQAQKFPSKQRMKEIELFANVLSEMQTSLQPWIPRFQKVLSTEPVNQLEEPSTSRNVAYVKKDTSHVVESPRPTKLDSLVSPSPLVSWRAGCTTEGGRQLFLVTPLPRPKAFSVKYQEEPKSVLENTTSSTMVQAPVIFDAVGEKNDDLLEGTVVKQTPRKVSDDILKRRCSSPENLMGREGSMLLMTPYLKLSPPKSCVLLEPVPEFRQNVTRGVYQSTPYPTRVKISEGSQDSESSLCRSSEKMSFQYTEHPGIKLSNNYGSRSKVVEESPYRMISPPKTCVLMEPPDDKLSLSDEAGSVLDHGANLLSVTEVDLQGGQSLADETCKQGLYRSFKIVESTPILRGPESSIQIGKHPGENTLKKELWEKFEAASIDGIDFDVSVVQQSAQKGFLDRLDEVS
ncbi:uncharacterized protein [Coffea arabica]|uniref:Uncharacterized protein n=1 Tax=Coffea arabica TaxID=13443 RepID=A0A6P6XJZ2_COFAR|nr:uncharacterized protein LOC113742669 [Coffea arabica]